MKNNQKNLFGRTRGLSSNAAKSISPNAVTNKRSFAAGQTGTTQQYASPNAVTNKRTFATGQSGSTAQTGKTTDYTSGKAASPNAVTNKRTFAAAGQGTSNQKQQSFDELYSPIQNQPTLPNREMNVGANASSPNAVTNKRSFTAVRTVGTIKPKPTQQEPVFNSITAGFGVNGFGAQAISMYGPIERKKKPDSSAPSYSQFSGMYANIRQAMDNSVKYGITEEDGTFRHIETEDKLMEDIQHTEGLQQYYENVAGVEGIKQKEEYFIDENKKGPFYDPLKPVADKVKGYLRNVDRGKVELASKMMHSSNLTAHAEEQEELEQMEQVAYADLAAIPYVLPEEVLRNPYMADNADLISLRVVGKEEEQNIRKALDTLYKTAQAHYIEGDYAMHAAATDCIAVLERKLPEYAYMLGAANEGLYQGPELVVAYQFAAHKGDEYQQTLDYLTSTEAVQTANPNAYTAGELGVNLVDITKTATGFADVATSQYAGKFVDMVDHGIDKQLRIEGYGTVLSAGMGKMLTNSMDNTVDQYFTFGLNE